jgi:ribonuclease D
MIKIFQNDLPDDSKIAEGDIAIDTEAMGLNFPRDRLCTVQFCDSKGQGYIVHFTSKEYSAPNLIKFFSDTPKS